MDLRRITTYDENGIHFSGDMIVVDYMAEVKELPDASDPMVDQAILALPYLRKARRLIHEQVKPRKTITKMSVPILIVEILP